MKCGPADYKTWMPSFAQSFQSDIKAKDTDCYITTVAYANLLGEVSFAAQHFEAADWLAPIYTFQEMLVQMTTVFSDCQTTNAAKQLMTRTTSFSGLFEVFGTAASAYVRQGQDPGTSDLYNAYNAWAGSADCSTQSLNTGLMMAAMLNYQTPDEVFYEQVNFSLLDQLSAA